MPRPAGPGPELAGPPALRAPVLRRRGRPPSPSSRPQLRPGSRLRLGSAPVRGGGKWRLLPAAAAETPPERQAGGAGAWEPVRMEGGAGRGGGDKRPRLRIPAPHEQVSPEAGASVQARERGEEGSGQGRGGCTRLGE